MFGGFLTPTESLEREAEIVGRFGALRLQTKSGAAALDGLFILTEHAMRFAQVDVKSGGVGPQRGGAADQLDGPSVMAALMVHDSEEMQRVGIKRLPRSKAS